MTTFVLLWDGTDLGYPSTNHRADQQATARGLRVQGRWSFGSTRHGAVLGDRVFLMRQRTRRGLVGSGFLAADGVHLGPHWTGDASRRTGYVEVEWDRMLAVVDRLPLETLLLEVPGKRWNQIYSGGQRVLAPADSALEALWRDHLGSLR